MKTKFACAVSAFFLMCSVSFAEDLSQNSEIASEAEVILEVDENVEAKAKDESDESASVTPSSTVSTQTESTMTDWTIGSTQDDVQIKTPHGIRQDGAFNYSHPIRLPEYRDLVPNLALNYSSSLRTARGNHSVMGPGWSLGGLSMIERISVGGGTPYFEDGRDIFRLDGMELLACDDAGAINKWTDSYPDDYKTTARSASCMAGGNFAPLIENFLKVQFNGTFGDQNATFNVWRKDGTKLTYETLGKIEGATLDVTHAAYNAVNNRVWLLTMIENHQAIESVVTISYHVEENDGYAWRLASISYAGYETHFGHTQMPRPMASFATGAIGHLGKQMWRLDSIRTLHLGTKIRAYNLNYMTTELTEGQRLLDVQEFGSDFVLTGTAITGGTSLPKVTFGYTAENNFEHSETLVSNTPLHKATSTWDWDDDGVQDVVSPLRYYPAGESSNTTKSYGGTHFGFSSDRSVRPFPTDFVEGRPIGTYWTMITSTSSSSGPDPRKYAIQERGGQANSGETYTRRNIVEVTQTGETLSRFSLGGGVGSIADSAYFVRPVGDSTNAAFKIENQENYQLLNPTGVSSVSATDCQTNGSFFSSSFFGVSGAVAERYVADLNGDSFASQIRFTIRSNSVIDKIAICDLVGTSLISTVQDMPDGWVANRIYDVKASDVNGDGREDIIILDDDHLVVALSNGRGLEGFKNWGVFSREPNVEPQLRLTDINGDGLSDAVVFHEPFCSTGSTGDDRNCQHNGTASIYLSKGDGFFSAESFTNFKVERFILAADLDGNGVADFVSGQKSATDTVSAARVIWADFQPPHLLTTITNSKGGTKTVSYLSSAHPDVNSDDQIPGIRQLVRHIDVADGRGLERRSSYEYSGGRFDWTYRKSLGFQSVKVTLPRLADETQDTWVSSHYLNGNLAQKGWLAYRDYFATGTQVQRINYDAAFRISLPFRALRTAIRDQNWESGVEQTRTTKFVMTGYGDVNQRSWLGYTDSAGTTNFDPSDDLTTLINYAQAPDAYIMDRPWRTDHFNSATVDNDKQLNYLRFYYDDKALKVLDGPGNLTSVRQWKGTALGGGTRQVVAYSYDAYGNLATETDARGAVTTHTYDTDVRMFPVTVVNPLGHMTTSSWSLSCQTPATSTDPNGLTTTYTYDTLCREIEADFASISKTQTRYFSFGNPASQRIVRVATSASTLAGNTDYVEREYFDGLGQVYKTTQSATLSSDLAGSIMTLTGYDLRGNIDWSSIPLLGSNSSERPADTEITRYSYDGQNRLMQTTYPDNARSQTEYGVRNIIAGNGSMVTHASTLSKNPNCFDDDATSYCGEVETITDASGRTIQNILFDRDSTDVGATGIERVTAYSYDALDRLTGVTDPGGNIWSYEYDAFGNRLISDDPDLGIWVMEYDDANNLIRQTDAKGQIITFAYDLLGRVTEKKVYKSDGTLEDTTISTYDDFVANYYNIGQLTEIENSDHRIRYRYNEYGVPRWERHDFDGRYYTTSRSFYRNGALKDIDLFNGGADYNSRDWVGQFSYDPGGRLISFDNHISDIDYDNFGNPTTIQYASGAVEVKSYDANRGWNVSSEVYDIDGTLQMSTVLSRHASGQIRQHHSLRGSMRYRFDYDYAGRLLNATNYASGAWTEQYTRAYNYTAVGSINSKSDIGTYLYNAANADHPHAPYQVGSTTLSYDANGNMTEGMDGKVMTYDAENRPLTVTKDGVLTEYVYGADGTRLKLTVNGETTVTFGEVEIRYYNRDNLNDTNEMVLTYPHPSVRLENGAASYLHRDHLSSIRLITSAAGAVDDLRTYAPFGTMRSWADPSATIETKGWIGERYDAGAGLQYLNARYYDPELGLFLQPDWFEVTEPGVGTNRYAYAGNDPTNLRDPGGNSWKAVKDHLGDYFGKKFDDVYEAAKNKQVEAQRHRAGKEHHSGNGVFFDEEGFPDFTDNLFKGKNDLGEEVIGDVSIGRFTGNHRKDVRRANKQAGFKKAPDGFRWHHHKENGRMQLVNKEIHEQVGHTGGAGLANRALGTLTQIMNSRALAVVGAFDPTNLLDIGLQFNTGHSLADWMFKTPDQRTWERLCNTGQCY